MANTEFAVHIPLDEHAMVWTEIKEFGDHEPFSTLRIKIGTATMLLYFYDDVDGARKVAVNLADSLLDAENKALA